MSHRMASLSPNTSFSAVNSILLRLEFRHSSRPLAAPCQRAVSYSLFCRLSCVDPPLLCYSFTDLDCSVKRVALLLVIGILGVELASRCPGGSQHEPTDPPPVALRLHLEL